MNDTVAGIDFGTTNSSIARINSSGTVDVAVFPFAGGLTDTYRSLLYLEQLKTAGKTLIQSWTGPEGIDHYLASEHHGRLIQSLKSFLSSRTLQSTDVFGRRRTLEDLIARILKDLREKAEARFGAPVRHAVAGRPVHFVGANNEADDQYAEARLARAFQLAGFETVRFELEPVAAAHHYESTLDHDELILIGDFGGGTSDFSLIRVGPGVRAHKTRAANLLGNSGVGLAGDAFDAKIVRHLVSPALGAGSEMRSIDKILPVPVWVYAKLERWHYLSLLRAKDVLEMLRSVHAQAFQPEKIAALIHLIEEDLGYHLHRAVQKTKCELSHQPAAKFEFAGGSVQLDSVVYRNDFERWIAPELHQIETCVDSLLKSCSVVPADVDRVFLTGGSSFVPAVRRIFVSRFGADRIAAGDEFTSVARGLALTRADALGQEDR